MALPTTAVIVPATAASDVYNDGSLPHGSAAITITGNGAGGGNTTYDCDNFNTTFPANRVEKTDRYGVPNAAFAVPKTPTGTATVQIATTATPIPLVGASFTADKTGAQAWLISEVSPPLEKEAYLVVNITFAAKLN